MTRALRLLKAEARAAKASVQRIEDRIARLRERDTSQ